MAADTWQNGGVDTRWDTAGNWVGGVPPGEGDTATFNDSGLDPPTANTGQETGCNLVFGGSGETGAFDDSNWSTDKLTDNATSTAGTITVGADSGVYLKGTTHGGVTVAAAGAVVIDGTNVGDVTFSAAGDLSGANTPLLDGDLLIQGAVTIDWANVLSISGSFDATGQVITHSNTPGATGTITLDTDDGARDFDLGTSGNIGDVAVTVNSGASTFTCKSALTCGVFTISGGTYADGGLAHVIGSHLDLSAGALTSTGTWTHNGTSNLVGQYAAGIVSTYAVGSTATITMTDDTTCVNLVIPTGGTLNLTGGELYIYEGTGNDQLDIQGTLSGNREIVWFPAANVNQKAVSIANTGLFHVRAVGSPTITMTGDFTLAGAFTFRSNIAAGVAVLDTNNHKLSVAGTTTIGYAGEGNSNGSILLKGACHSLAGLVGGHANNLANNFDAGSAYVEIANGSTWDGTHIATLANVASHFMALGTLDLSNMDGSDPGEKLHFHSAPGAITDSGNNDYADIDAHVAPGNPGLP